MTVICAGLRGERDSRVDTGALAYATGAVHIAAGCSILARLMDQVATAALAVMFASWALVCISRVHWRIRRIPMSG